MVSELRHWWRILRTAILTFGILLSFLAFVEVLHVYVILRDTYSPLGYAFLLLITTGFICFLIYIFLKIMRRPRALLPPNIEDLANASSEEFRTYSRYLISYLERLIKNPNLAPDDVTLATQTINQLEQLFESSDRSSELIEKIDRVEKEGIEPLLSKLDEMADAEVRKSVRDIMLGVTLSPFRAVDLIIVIYRNASMVNRTMGIYYSRPILAEQIVIFRDVLKVVATVNYLNFGQKLVEKLFSRLPFIGQVLDDLAQGIGAGLFTSIAGHGTIVRCRAYKGWDEEIAVEEMPNQIKEFMKDVKNICIQDILPKMRSKVYSTASADEVADPAFWEKTTEDISSAIDDTGTILDSVIRKPVLVVSKGTIKAGSTAISKSRSVIVQGTSVLSRGAKSASSKITATSGSSWKAIRRIFRKEK